MQQITLAITTYNRFSLVKECVQFALHDPRIGEILIVDDKSTDGSFALLEAWAEGLPKVRLVQNEKNVDCYANKARAVAHAKYPWVILFDSDNILLQEYIDKIYTLEPWDVGTVYLPDFARPYFNYQSFSGRKITRHNVAWFMPQPHFPTCLNTCNFFVYADTYLAAFELGSEPHTADSIFMAHNLLRNGATLHVVKGLQYMHLVHPGSHYKNNVHKTGNFASLVVGRLKEMR